MAKVLGIGGVFVKTPDLEAWKAWYSRVLGVEMGDYGCAMFDHPDKGNTNLAPFKADSDYFKPSQQPFMINLIVDDLGGVLDKARAAGVEPLGREDHDYGSFAWLLDPAGIKIELWEPREAAAG